MGGVEIDGCEWSVSSPAL